MTIKQGRLVGSEGPDADWIVGWDVSGHGYIMHLREPRFLAKRSLKDDGSLTGFSYIVLLGRQPATRDGLMTLLRQAERAWKAWQDDWENYDA